MIRDPHHLPRWWPRVTRVEDVEDGAFTEVMRTRKGKFVRSDFKVVICDEAEHLLTWAQQVEGTPFARLLKSAETEVRLRASATSGQVARAEGSAGEVTEVTIELRQVLNGMSPRFGGFMVRRAARATVDEALDGLERIGG
jgi:uncharacterized protein YndB with AHSA1/START domain